MTALNAIGIYALLFGIGHELARIFQQVRKRSKSSHISGNPSSPLCRVYRALTGDLGTALPLASASGRFFFLRVHALKFCPAELRNATQLFCGGLRA